MLNPFRIRAIGEFKYLNVTTYACENDLNEEET